VAHKHLLDKTLGADPHQERRTDRWHLRSKRSVRTAFREPPVESRPSSNAVSCILQPRNSLSGPFSGPKGMPGAVFGVIDCARNCVELQPTFIAKIYTAGTLNSVDRRAIR